MKALKVLIAVLVMLFLSLPAWAGAGKDLTDAKRQKVMEGYGKLPLYFIENNGQVDEKVRFYEKGAGHSILKPTNFVGW